MGFYFSPTVQKGIYGSAKFVNKVYGKKAWRQGKRVMSKLGFKNKSKSKSRTMTKSRTYTKSLNKVGSQWTTTKNNFRLSKPISSNGRTMKLVNASKQSTVYRWNAVKSFDDHGFYFLPHSTGVEGRTELPLFTFDITSCWNANLQGGTYVKAKPMSSAYIDATGDIYFQSRAGLPSDGSTLTDDLELEKASFNILDPVIYPNNKDILKWVSIKANLWGCKNRSTKYKLMLVRFTDDRIIPHHETLPTTQRTEFFQSLLKPYVFNPIATTNNNFIRKMKVLKFQEFQIEDTSTDSTDQDPIVKNVSWYVRMDKLVNYVEQGQKLTTMTNATDEADYTQSIGNQNTCYTQPKSRIFLMVIASNYGKDATITNVGTPSFDISVRMSHESLS